MWDVLLNFGMLAVFAILLVGAVLSYFLLSRFIGEEPSVIIGILLAAYPAYWAFQKV